MSHNPVLDSLIVDLQTRVAFQEDALQVMSEQMAAQAAVLAVAQQHIQLLNQKLNDLTLDLDSRGQSSINERPPHY